MVSLVADFVVKFQLVWGEGDHPPRELSVTGVRAGDSPHPHARGGTGLEPAPPGCVLPPSTSRQVARGPDTRHIYTAPRWGPRLPGSPHEAQALYAPSPSLRPPAVQPGGPPDEKRPLNTHTHTVTQK